MAVEMRVPEVCWSQKMGRYNVAGLLGVNRSCHLSAKDAWGNKWSLQVLQCPDGKAYVEDVFNDIPLSVAEVFKPRERSSTVFMHNTTEEAIECAKTVLSGLAGIRSCDVIMLA